MLPAKRGSRVYVDLMALMVLVHPHTSSLMGMRGRQKCSIALNGLRTLTYSTGKGPRFNS